MAETIDASSDFVWPPAIYAAAAVAAGLLSWLLPLPSSLPEMGSYLWPAIGALDSTWFLIAIVVAVYAVTKRAIEREERYLDAKFGEVYRAYRARVPRSFGPF